VGLKLALDFGAALLEVRDDLSLVAQLRFVLYRVVERDLRLAHEAMPARVPAGLQAEHFARYQLGAMQHHQAVHRAHELRVAVAPAHHLGHRQGLERRFDPLREYVGEQDSR